MTDPNGRIILAGHQFDSGSQTNESVIERLNPDGTLDTTFGNKGSIASAAGLNDAFYAIAMDATGRIYVAGTQNGDFTVERLKSTGTIDAKFGTRGRATTDAGAANDTAYGIALGADGSIVLGGGSDSGFAFAKFTNDGTLDTTFGTGGRTTITTLSGATGVTGGTVVGALAIDSQGRIVAVGGNGDNVAVVRLLSNGGFDPSFAGGAAVTLNGLGVRNDLGGPDRTEGLALQDDRIVVANRTPGGDFGIARLNADGTLDTTFGNAGLTSVDFGGDDDADAIVMQGTGQMFVLGTTDAGGPATAVAALTPDGALDTSFNGTGTFTVAAGVTQARRALHIGGILLRAFGGIEANGQLVVGTPSQSPSATATPLRRLNVPGSGTVGTFGAVAGRNKKLAFLDGDGSRVMLTLKGGGTGTAFYDGTSIDLVLSGTTASSALAVKGVGGNGRVRLRDIRSSGALRSFSGKNSDITGTFFVNGALGKVSAGTVTGTIASANSIGNVSLFGSLTGAQVLAGANFGADGKAGGTGSNADTFAAGSIKAIKVSGSVATSTVAAGVNPVNGTYGDNDDLLLGGTGSAIQRVSIRGTIDTSSRFIAGAFGKARIPQPVDPATDPHFTILT